MKRADNMPDLEKVQTASNAPMTEAGKAARREYKRAWNAANKDKVREAQKRYWEKKALETR